MADYKEMYLMLFRAITKAIILLQEMQRQTEELFISAEDDQLVILTNLDFNNEENITSAESNK